MKIAHIKFRISMWLLPPKSNRRFVINAMRDGLRDGNTWRFNKNPYVRKDLLFFADYYWKGKVKPLYWICFGFGYICEKQYRKPISGGGWYH